MRSGAFLRPAFCLEYVSRMFYDPSMNKETFERIVEEHQDFLDGKPCGKRAEFKEVSLKDMTLEGVDLSQASFDSVDFSEVNVSNVNFSNAAFHSCNMTACFCGSKFNKSTFNFTSMIDSEFSSCEFKGTKFYVTHILSSNLHDLKVEGGTWSFGWPRVSTENYAAYMLTPRVVTIGCTTMGVRDWLGEKGRKLANSEYIDGLEYSTLLHWVRELDVIPAEDLGYKAESCQQ